MPSQGAPPATPEDLDETVREVEKQDRRIVARRADASDLDAVTAVLDEGLAEFGRVDVVVANAGVQGNPGPIAQTTAEEWHAVLATRSRSNWASTPSVSTRSTPPPAWPCPSTRATP